MEGVIFCCPPAWRKLLPPGVLGRSGRRRWRNSIATAGPCTRRGVGELGDTAALCRVLLVPGDCTAPLERITAETVVTYGLSSRDSLTLSSLAEPVLCVQRQLPPAGAAAWWSPRQFPLAGTSGSVRRSCCRCWACGCCSCHRQVPPLCGRLKTKRGLQHGVA
mgnify:CR=1 FL=1